MKEIVENKYKATVTLMNKTCDQSSIDIANLNLGLIYVTCDATESASDYQPQFNKNNNNCEKTLSSDMQISKSSEKINKNNIRDISDDERSHQSKDNFMSVMKFSKNNLNDVDQTLLFNNMNNNNDKNKKVENNDNYNNNAVNNAGEKKNHVTC